MRNAGCSLLLFTVASGQVPEAPDFDVRPAVPPDLVDEAAPAGELFVRHPWAIRDRRAELELERAGGAPPPTRNVITQEGVEFVVTANAAALPAGATAAVYFSYFSYSFTTSEPETEKWMIANGFPPVHNPLRLSNIFAHDTKGAAVVADDLGDVCLGEQLRIEWCARVASCFNVGGQGSAGGGRWRVAAKVPFAANYRVEAYLADASPSCRDFKPVWLGAGGVLGQAPGATALDEFVWWAPPVAEHAVEPRLDRARIAALAKLRLLHVNKASAWWAQQAAVKPVTSWSEMMSAIVDAAADLVDGRGALHPLAPHGLWLEFGVGSGKTTAIISWKLKSRLPDVKLHGFDSFMGLPLSWEHTKLQTGTFTLNGQVPEHLVGDPHIQVHVGLFSSTLGDLDAYGDAPVAFAHVDVDIYASAVEVLSRIACQLYPGSMLLFDELVNYVGFELSGEYRAWEYIASTYQIRWQYAGIFWQQAVPILILGRGQVC